MAEISATPAWSSSDADTPINNIFFNFKLAPSPSFISVVPLFNWDYNLAQYTLMYAIRYQYAER